MNQLLLPVTVRAQSGLGRVRTKLRATWDDRADETGLDEAVTKMIWLAVGIGVAVAATAFFIGVFDTPSPRARSGGAHPVMVAVPTLTNPGRDRGAVDVSIEMLFGMVAMLMVLLLLFETVAYWHARNVFDDAAAEGVRIAAAFDGSCADGVAVARDAIARHARSWAGGTSRCRASTGAMVVVSVTGRTPGVLGDAAGVRASVSDRRRGAMNDGPIRRSGGGSPRWR